MPRSLDIDTLKAISDTLTSAGYTWEDFTAYFTSVAPTPAVTEPAPAPAPKSDVDAAWVKATAEAILKSNCKLSTNAGTFVAQTFARASNYPTVRFSPKQWDWFNKIMLDAGIEAMDLPVEVK